MPEQIRDRLAKVDPERLRADLFALSRDPLPCRKLNHTLPWHSRSTLDECDDYLAARLDSLGYTVEREPVPVQALRCDQSKQPKNTWYSSPLPGDPWYTAHNLYARRRGGSHPDEILLLCAHKDSQSWVGSPGALDNAVGTVALLELARLLADHDPQRSLCLLWCNEEHSPWTSVQAARAARERGDNLVAVQNVDGIAGRSPAEEEAGRRTHVTLWTEPPGQAIAELTAEVISSYGIALEHRTAQRPHPNDDDGSFVKAGFGAAVVHIGSFPYGHRYYHDERDVPEGVDIGNLALSTQAVLGTTLRLDRDGAPG